MTGGVSQFDDNAVLKAAGLPELTDEQLFAFQDYWLQEASPGQKADYLAKKDSGAYTTEWRKSRL